MFKTLYPHLIIPLLWFIITHSPSSLKFLYHQGFPNKKTSKRSYSAGFHSILIVKILQIVNYTAVYRSHSWQLILDDLRLPQYRHPS